MTWEIKAKKLYRVTEKEPDEDFPMNYITLRPEWHQKNGYVVNEVAENDLSIDELIDFCESNAENDNFHGMTSTANNLVTLMREVKIEEDKIHQLMFKIVMGGGVHML